MPLFSIILPTYNRADTLGRALDSIRAQREQDWELVLVDDGSTDGTQALLQRYDDPRLRVLRQENRGVSHARNAGLAAARGQLISFLDSDDEWPPHHLALMAAFFAAHPDEHLACGEWWEVFGPGKFTIHFHVEMRDWYPKTAQRIGSHSFRSPPPYDDPVLRFYQTRAPLGAWAHSELSPELRRGAWHYRGDIFRGWRWGWLDAVQPTVITRTALEAVGGFDESYPVASDFVFLAELCRRFPMNFFTVPGCYKHELGQQGRPIAHGHLVSGETSTRFHADVLRAFEQLFYQVTPDDPELKALRGFRQVLAAKAALHQGDHERARGWLEEAAHTYPGLDTSALLLLARAPLGARPTQRIYDASVAASRLPGRVTGALRRLGAGPKQPAQ